MLRRNIALNHLGHVQVVEAAAVDDPDIDTVELLIPSVDHFSTPAGAFIGSGERSVASATSVTVEATDVAGLVEGADLLKMDIEGQEHRILARLSGYLEKSRPTIFLEVLPNTPKLRDLLVSIIETQDYQCFQVSREGIVPMTAPEISESSPHQTLGLRDVILTTDTDLIAKGAAAE